MGLGYSLGFYSVSGLPLPAPDDLADNMSHGFPEGGSACPRDGRRGSASGAGGGSGEPAKRGVVDGIPVASEGTWPAGVE